MARSNYHKNLSKSRKGDREFAFEHRKHKEMSRPLHTPKTLRKEIKKEKIKSKKSR